MNSKPLSRRTKDEILEDYNRLLEKYEELKMAAKLVADPASIELVERAGQYHQESIGQSIANLKGSVNNTLNELSDKLLAEAQKFVDIQTAIDLTKKNLELHYNVQIAAETLEQLVNEHKAQQAAAMETIENQKRDWAREQEEHDYNTKLARARELAAYEEQKGKKERELTEREAALSVQQAELERLRAQAEAWPGQLEKALTAREQETAKIVSGQSGERLQQAKKEWDAEKNIYEMRINNLEEQGKRLTAEIGLLKQETERANKRVQEMAIKVIEGRSASAVAVESKGPSAFISPKTD